MKLIVSCLLALSVFSCSTNSKIEGVQYKTSQTYPSLEIPPDLTGLDDSKNKALAGSIIGTKAAVGKFKETGAAFAQVLPKLAGISLKGEGSTHWIEVDEDATGVYALLKSFWAEEGFKLTQDEPIIGIMKTEWLENKAGYLSDDESIFSNIFAFFYDTDFREQYRTRVARGDMNGFTKIYLTQYGQEFMLSDSEYSEKTTGWQSMAHDPELEVEMLSRMMLFLGLHNSDLKDQLAKIGQFKKRALLLNSEDGVTTLILRESLDRGWNRLINQLERLEVDELKKDKEKYLLHFKQTVMVKKQEQGFLANFFGFDKPKIKEVEENVTMTLMLEETNINTTSVKVVDANGVVNDSDYADALLKFLYIKLK